MKTHLLPNDSVSVWIYLVMFKMRTGIYVNWLWVRIKYVSVYMYTSYIYVQKFFTSKQN